MKMKIRRGLALLLTLCLLGGNLAFAEELPVPSTEMSISEEAPAQNEETMPRENEAEPPEKNEAEAPEGNEENAPAEDEEALEVSPEHTPEAQMQGAPEGLYAFSFTVVRPEDSEFGTIFKTYHNYWLTQTGAEIFDQDNWRLRSFQIAFDLHMPGTAQSIRQNMSYDADEYEWNTRISFENIHIPYPDVELEYYSPENEDWFDPWLLHYDLYLEKGDGKMILKVPKLKSIEPNHIPSGNNQVLQVTYNDPMKLDTLYLNGTTGKDENDGFQPDAPLKTLPKAKEIALATHGIEQIVVTGETALTGDISFAGLSTTVKRAENYTGYLFYVPENASASLSNIVMDGNADNNTNIIESLIKLKPGSTLEVKKGTVLKENFMKRGTVTLGGAIYARDAHLKMTGGVVEDNQATYGGGIYLSHSTMDFSGGIVRKNWSERVGDSTEQAQSAGGGILATDASTINFSGQAEIRDNYAYEVGGGISLGTRQAEKTNILNMTGGIIDDNTAGACGGGIFIQAGISSDKDGYKGESKAYISGGQITDNRTTGNGLSNDFFAGGGIYVNGFREEGYWLGNTEYYGANGELHLKNAIIRENTSKEEGAGLGACPTSKTTFHINDGVAIYNNTIDNAGREKEGKTAAIYSALTLGAHSGRASYKLSKRMLGGALWNWRKFIDRSTGDIPLPEEDYNETVLPAQEWLKLNSSDKANALTEVLGTVIISGNSSATRGGGIGSNGTVIFGTEGKTVDIPVEKKWDDNNNAKKIRPESITVELIATYEGKSYVVETRELSEANEWKTVFKELPTKNAGNPITYKVKEIAVAGYDSKITWSADKGFVITNKPEKPPRPGEKFVEIPVEKLWQDEGREDKRPTEITVTLYADGVATEKTLILNAKNEWKGVFRNLPEKKDGKIITYTVKEVEVKGFDRVEGRENGRF